MGLRAGLDKCGKSRPTGIQSPDLPARSESLYRLRYPGSWRYTFTPPICPDGVGKEIFQLTQWNKVLLVYLLVSQFVVESFTLHLSTCSIGLSSGVY